MLGIKSLFNSVSRISNSIVSNITQHMNIQIRCMANHKHKKIIKEVKYLYII
jgi:hypothetical protein